MITPKIVYATKGREFRTAREALDHRENLVEAFVRECPGFQDVPLKQRIGFVQHILANRALLRDLLDYSDKIDYSDFAGIADE